jgi:hypothetical protein
VARKDLSKLHPLCEALQRLWQEGLIGVHLLRIFFSSRIQPLWRQRTKMGMHPGPSCPDHPSFEELSAAEVDARIHKVLDLGVKLDLRVSLSPYREGLLEH